MELFTELMKNDQIKFGVYIKFGFGYENESEVEKWIKETSPETYYEIMKNIKSTKIVEFTSKEKILTADERTTISDQSKNYFDVQKQREVVRVYRNDLDELMKINNKLGYELEQYDELLFKFIHENDLRTKFYNFLIEKKDKGEIGFVIDEQLYLMSLYNGVAKDQS